LPDDIALIRWATLDVCYRPKADIASGPKYTEIISTLPSKRFQQLQQLTRGDISFFDAPEPVLTLHPTLDGAATVLAAFNRSSALVTIDWPATVSAGNLAGHGLPGDAAGGKVTLPAYVAWFGTTAS